jgi:D-3-phosphoglycerate dehydrogenase
MQVGRDAAGGLALIALTVDTAVDPQTVGQIAGRIAAVSGAAIDLL